MTTTSDQGKEDRLAGGAAKPSPGPSLGPGKGPGQESPTAAGGPEPSRADTSDAGAPPPAEGAAELSSIRPPADGEVVLIGRLRREGISSCTEEDRYTRTWTNVSYFIGMVGLALPAKLDVRALKPGALVVARGRLSRQDEPFEALRLEDPPLPKGAKPELCGPYQMRDDWRETPDGIVRSEPDLAPFGRSALRVETLEAWAGLSTRVLEERPDEVQITLKGTGGVAIPEVEITAHYEGCYGKPGAREASSKFALPVAGNATVVFPLLAEEPPGQQNLQQHALDSLRVVGAAQGVHFALSVPVQDLGIESACVEREKPAKAAPSPSP